MNYCANINATLVFCFDQSNQFLHSYYCDLFVALGSFITIKFTSESKVITDRHMIADMFNNSFATIGKDLACSIPIVEMSPLEYLKTLPCNSFFFVVVSPARMGEFESEINNLNSSKATGPFSIPFIKPLVYPSL